MTLSDITAEVWVNGSYDDITGDVLVNPGIKLKRGRSNWGSKQSVAAQATFQLLNTADCSVGDRGYDPRWPASPYFGIWGRGVPIRITTTTAIDAFARTVASGWDTSDSGYAWSIYNNPGDSASVSPGSAVHTVASAGTYIVSALDAFAQRDVLISTECELASSTVTGGDLEPANIVWRWHDLSNCYLARVAVATDGTISVKVTRIVAGVGTDLVAATDTGLSLAGTQRLGVAVLAEGNLHRVKVWDANGAEPYDWTVTVVDDDYPDHVARGVLDGQGSAGVRSGIAAGNTDAPVTFTYHSFRVASPRFLGTVSDLKQRSNETGSYRWVEVIAAGPFRRAQSGKTPVLSTLRRYWTADTTVAPLAYWPCEDGRSASSVVSGMQTGSAMTSYVGVSGSDTPQFASESSLPSSLPLLKCRNSPLAGPVPPIADPGFVQLILIMVLPDSGMADGDRLFDLPATGSIGNWQLMWHTDGGIELLWFDQLGNLVGQSGVVAFNANGGQIATWSIELTQSGSDIDWVVKAIDRKGIKASYGAVGVSGGVATGTVAGRSLGHAYSVRLDPDGMLPGVAFGHVAVTDTYLDVAEFAAQFIAYDFERARDRVVRLGGENGLIFDRDAMIDTGSVYASVHMGPQLPKTLLELVEECGVADNSLYFEARGVDVAVWRPSSRLCSQTPVLTLDYAAGEVGAVLEPVDDDSALVNRVTASNSEGGEVTVEQPTGRLSTADPQDGGVGVYDSAPSVNGWRRGDLMSTAGWLLHLGTFDEARYPSLPVNRHAPEIAGTQLAVDVLDVNLGDLIEVDNVDAADRLLLTLGYTETIRAATYTFEFNCDPGEPWRTAVADQAGHKADTGGSELDADATSGAGTLSVATTSGPPWVDSATFPGEFPFDVDLGGERVTVTAISGTTSPQTFTVTRAVNGITKAHVAGTRVALSTPVYASPGVRKL